MTPRETETVGGAVLTEAQRKLLSRAAASYGMAPKDKREANIADRLDRAGFIRMSAYGDKFFATDAGRAALRATREQG